MPPRPWAYGNLEEEDLPVRDRPEESFGQQGVGLPTYGDEPTVSRGAERVELGEPMAPASRNAVPGEPKAQGRDDRIHREVCEHLEADHEVDASDIEVIVHHGEVTLSGAVADNAQRARAVHVAESVRGVIDVVGRLRVAAASR